MQQSGSRRTLLPPSPLRTVRAPLSAHGSSTSHTALLLLLFLLCLSSDFAFCRQQVTVVKLLAITQCSFRRGVNVLMAQKMNQDKITVDILSPFSAGMEVMDLEFFIIEEGLSTLWASTMVPLCELLFGESQVFRFRCLSLHPVALEAGIIG